MTVRGGSANTVGRRPAWSEHKARVQRALVDAALELFSTQGYDATSTEQIAALAGVSPRTFFRYFPTKESVLFFGEDDFVRSFVGVYLAQPSSLTEFQAMQASFVTLAPGLTRLRTRIKLYRKAVASSSLLRGREQDNHDANVATIARAIAERREMSEPDETCELLAAVGVLVLDRAMARWLDGRVSRSFGEHIAAEFADLTRLVCAPRDAVKVH